MSDVDAVIWHRVADPVAAGAEALARHLLEAGPAPRLAVAGGSAAAALAPLRERLGPARWGRLRVTWVDERRVPLQSPDSNRGAAHRAGWLGPAAPVGTEIPLWLDEDTCESALQRVTRAIAVELEGGLDALLLGMGEDGHVASLFPGHPSLTATGPVACIDDAPKPPPQRLTLCLPLLATTRVAVLVVTGASKREALRRLRAGDPALPAARVPQRLVFTDQDV